MCVACGVVRSRLKGFGFKIELEHKCCEEVCVCVCVCFCLLSDPSQRDLNERQVSAPTSQYGFQICTQQQMIKIEDLWKIETHGHNLKKH